MSLANLNSALQALGYTQNGGSGVNSSDWSTFQATQNVNIAHHNINNINDLNLVNNTDPANIYTTTLVTSDSGELEVFAPSTSIHSNNFFVVGSNATQSKITIQDNSIIIGRDPTATLSVNSTGNLATSVEVTKASDDNSLVTVKYINGLTGSDLSIWATFPASQDVDMANHALNNVTTINTSGIASLNGGGNVPNIASGTNNTQIANTAFVANAVSSVSGGGSINSPTFIGTYTNTIPNALAGLGIYEQVLRFETSGGVNYCTTLPTSTQLAIIFPVVVVYPLCVFYDGTIDLGGGVKGIVAQIYNTSNSTIAAGTAIQFSVYCYGGAFTQSSGTLI